MNINDHLDNLIRHIDLVRENCILLGKRLIGQGRKDFGRLLIANGFVHDQSKFFGIEWQYLHVGPDVDKDHLQDAIKQHTACNTHHPEYWGGMENMPEIACAEFLCDCYARAQEFGTSLREWLVEEAVEKYHIDLEGDQWKWIQNFTNLLLQDSFKRA
jgi:hypothetical protein